MAGSAYLGVIEGFFGKSYGYTKRSHLLDFIHKNNYSFYIYAPKEDKALRSDLSESMPESTISELSFLGQKSRILNIDFGIGISPLNLSSSFDSLRNKLLQRIDSYTKRTNSVILALLFDDVKLEDPHIGFLQNKIIKDIYDNMPSRIKRLIVCPSYYSEDPILDRVFGKRPEHYFTELTASLPSDIDIFWTGPKVLSQDITENDILRATELLGRKPFIWDNYPVNDGKNIADFLFLSAFKGRRNLLGKIEGHAVNPMLEMYLSYPALTTLPLIYKNLSDSAIKDAWLKCLNDIFKDKTKLILENQKFFEKEGLSKISQIHKDELLSKLINDSSPAVLELKDYLLGKYRFDPACLT